MSQLSHPFEQARAAKDQAVAQASPFVEKFARFGYAAKGVVYGLIGVLALLAAVGSGGDRSPGSRDALRTLADQPFGQVLLVVIAVGLAGYAIWQFMRAVEDPEHEGSDARGIARRAVFFISGIVHASLVAYAWHLVLGDVGGSGDGEQARGLTARVMSWPAGKWLVVAGGLFILGYGAQQIMRAWKAKVTQMLDLSEMDVEKHRAAVMISRIGMGARGIVFAIIGAFAVAAAWKTDPSRAKGLGEAIAWVQNLPMGWLALAGIAVGLIAYGIYMFIKARYRRIHAA